MRDNVKKLFYFFLFLFFLVFLQLGFWQLIAAADLENHVANKRGWAAEEAIVRGGIYDRYGNALAVSQKGQKREYGDELGLGVVLGYHSAVYGRSGLENAYNRALLGLDDGYINTLLDKLQNKELRGNDLILTLDSKIQRVAYEALGGRRGAVVVLQPQTGEILAEVSSPSFALTRLEKDWSQLNQDRSAPLLNRALQGAYPPGSTLKVAVAAAALESGQVTREQTYQCLGYQMIGGRKLACNKGIVHGKINIYEAFVVSCNSYFSQLGILLGNTTLDPYLEKLNRYDPAHLQVRKSSLQTKEKLNANALAERAIGQGKLLVTPFYMANLAAVVANDGWMMRPFLVAEIKKEGRTREKTVPERMERVFEEKTVNVIQEMMVQVVNRGTGKAAALSGVQIAGKTGSAQTPNGQAHAWFIGFAPAENPTLALAVIVENGGSGGAVAAPIARQIIGKSLESK